MAADDYAQSVSGNTSSYAFKEAMWNKTKYFTTTLFNNASHALAELIYNAWLEAGSPSMLSISDFFENKNQYLHLMPNYPNPFSNITEFEVVLSETSNIQIEVRDVTGSRVELIANKKIGQGNYTFTWNPGIRDCGIYYLVLETGTRREVRKMILTE